MQMRVIEDKRVNDFKKNYNESSSMDSISQRF